jgi:LPXTG-motif cell wall-anchored protein/uncharacterized repeat protein (TIGR02543 family)
MGEYFLALRRQMKRYRAAALSVMCVVVFATTYALILPAITIDQNTAAGQAGMSVASSSASASSASSAASSAQEATADDAASSAPAHDAEQQAESATGEPQAADAAENDAADDAAQTSAPSDQAAATLTATQDGYQVTVDYGEEAGIAEGSTLSVKEYAQDSDEYQTAKQKVIDAKKAAGEQVDEDTLGFAAFDISILDKDGNKVEPADGSEVSVKLTANNLPDQVDASTLQVQHIKDNASGDVETVADAANTSKDTVSLDGTTANADFTVGSFSTFTLTYRGNRSSSDPFSQIRVVDEKGNSLGTNKSETITSRSTSLSNLASSANPDSTTYAFAGAEVGTSFDPSATLSTSGTIGYSSSWYYDSYWYYALDGTSGEFDSDDILYLVYKVADVTLSFDANGGSSTAPSSISGKAGTTVTLPTYDGTRNGYTFLGWTDTANLTGDTNYHPVYPAGSEYTLSATTTRLYAAWSNKSGTSRSDFYVRLDGTIPTEPGSYAGSDYASGIRIDNNVKDKRWIVDTTSTSISGPNAQNKVTANLNTLPTVDQLVTDLNKSRSTLGFTVKNDHGELVVDSITNAKVNENGRNVSVGDDLYVLWYVQKLQSTANAGNTWHIDGVLLVKSKVTITYVANTNDTVNSMPRGYQTPKDTTITIGADGSATGTVLTPTRTGYNFLGWNTKADGSGTWYYNNNSYVLSENTTLYAQWERKTTGITVYKVDSSNTSKQLDGATFKLTKMGADGTYQAVTIDGVTDPNGVFTVSKNGTNLTGLDDGTYQLTEITAPSGYIVTSSSTTFTISDGVAQNFGSGADNAWLINNNRLTIKNTPGAPLPTTGGMGTLAYSAAGAALVLIALISGFVLRRRSHRKGGC